MADDLTQYTTPQGEMAADPAAMTGDTLLDAMWRQSTTPGSLLSSQYLKERIFNSDPTPVTTDDLIGMMDRDQMWGHEDQFLEVRTRGTYNAIVADIKREEADRAVIAEAGVMKSLGAGLLVAPLDPINWLPVGAAVRGIRTGSTVLNTTARTAAATGIAVAAQEPAFQASQVLRTAEEAAWDIGGSVALGAILGFGVAATPVVASKVSQTVQQWASTADWNERAIDALGKVWTQANDDIINNPAGRRIKGGGRSPSAKQLETRDVAFDALQSAAERHETFKSLGMASTGPFEWARTAPGRLLSQVAGPHFRDPIDYVTKRASSLEARKALEQIAEIPVMLRKNLDGVPTAQAVTTEVDQFMGRWAEFRDAVFGGSMTQAGKRMMGKGESLYTQSVKQGFTGTVEQFDKEVTKAVVNGHVHPNPAIEKAAGMFKQVTDMVETLAKQAGYETSNGNVRYALGYAPRKYIVPSVIGPDGQGTAFKARARQAYHDDILDAEFTSQGKVPTPQQLAGIRKRSKTLATQAFRRITREEHQEGGLVQRNISAGNPLNERVLPIPDNELLANGWIDPRATDLLNVHVRQTVPALLLAKRFKSPTGLPDPSLENSLLPAITKEYEPLLATAKNPAERAMILEERDTLTAMFRRMADQIVHSPRVGGPGWMRRSWEKFEGAVQMVKLYEVTRLMGGLLAASVPDAGNFQLRHGLSRPLKAFVNDLRPERLFNALQFKGMTPEAIASEAKRIGAAMEWATNSDMAAHLDLLSPYQANTPFQRGMSNMARTFSVTNFSVWWNDTMKTKSFRIGMDRVLEAAEKGFDNIPDMDRQFLAVLGLGKAEVNRIGAAWRTQAGGMDDGFLRVAYATGWDDQEAARIFANALAKDNASTVVRPRIGDKALAWNNPVMQVITQFQNFVSSHALRTITYAEQRVIQERGFGPDSFRVYGGMATMAMLGMGSAMMFAMAKDAIFLAKGEPAPSVEKLINNPGQWIALGIERSSLLGMYGYHNAYWERLGNTGLTRPLQNIMGDESRQVDARGRWMDREPAAILGGPFISGTNDMIRTGGHWWDYMFDDRAMRAKDARTMREAMPFQNHVILRHFFDYVQKDLIADAWMGIDQTR